MIIITAEKIIETLIALTHLHHPSQSLDLPTLKKNYLSFLKDIQPYCPRMSDDNLFHSSLQVENEFTQFFTPDSRISNEAIIYDAGTVMYPDASVRAIKLQSSLETLDETDPIFAKLFRLVMNTVFCTGPHRVGGTSVNPSFVGVMCAYYDMTAEENAIPELFIHEFTHNILFLDEFRYKHYHDIESLNHPSTFVTTTDRGDVPFERWFHALIVYAEIIHARDKYIGHDVRVTQHEPTDILISRAKVEIVNAKKNKLLSKILTDRAIELLHSCDHFYSAR